MARFICTFFYTLGTMALLASAVVGALCAVAMMFF